jgi:hypothetical protein
MRVQEREEDEHCLRLSVEKRASKAAIQDGTAAAFDSQYIMQELVITIEADQMIYFDLLDLPGLDNSSPMPKKMVCKYINAGTLPRTFVLIFAEHKKGDTQLMHRCAVIHTYLPRRCDTTGIMLIGLMRSLAFAELARVNEEVGDPGLWKQFITQRCLGVLTKVDKELESNTAKTPTEYDKDAATKLRSSLNCTDHPPHLDKWPWVAVLNPNKEEQEQVRRRCLLRAQLTLVTSNQCASRGRAQNMSFEEACKKEKWFFDTLFPPGLEQDEATRQMCGIGNFRSKLVDRYEKFVAKQIKLAAPKVFAKVVVYGKHMSEAWAWEAEQECYEDKEKMLQVLAEMINEMATIGKDSSEPTSVINILLRDDVQQCIQRCRERVDPSTALEHSKLDLMKLMATVSAKLIEQVHLASQQLKYKRFLTLGKRMVKVMVFVSRQFFVVTERQLDAVIATEEERYQHIPCHTRPIQEMINSLVSCAKSELSRLAQLIEDFPTLSPRYMVVDPPAFLEHTRPKIAELKPPFGFVCSSDGLVNSVVDADRCAIPKGSTVLQIDGRDFTQSAMLESANQPRPVRFAYSTPGCGVVPDSLEITKWMYHHQHVSRVYLEERERFLCHRRAAEILVLLFDEETAGGAERAAFEGMQGGKQLVLLESEAGDDWYERNYHGGRPNLPPDAAANGSMSLSFQIELPGTCCTNGCARTHDTAFNPCGHTVCCWECATLLDTCPVCGIDLTCTTGTAELPFRIREPKDLCYDHPPTEADHQLRVKLATQHDSDTRQATKDEYGQMLFAFADPQEVSPDAAWEALERHRQALLRKPDRLEGQMRLWPTFADLMEQKENFETRLREQKQQAALELAEEKQRAADERDTERQQEAAARQEAAAELAQEKQRAWLAARQAETAARQAEAAACAIALRQGQAEMFDYAKELEVILGNTDCRVRKACYQNASICQAEGCGISFGFLHHRYNCSACGLMLCKEHCSTKYPFEGCHGTSTGTVCGPCYEALMASCRGDGTGGTRSRLVPAQRPDGSDFGS